METNKNNGTEDKGFFGRLTESESFCKWLRGSDEDVKEPIKEEIDASWAKAERDMYNAALFLRGGKPLTAEERKQIADDFDKQFDKAER